MSSTELLGCFYPGGDKLIDVPLDQFRLCRSGLKLLKEREIFVPRAKDYLFIFYHFIFNCNVLYLLLLHQQNIINSFCIWWDSIMFTDPHQSTPQTNPWGSSLLYNSAQSLCGLAHSGLILGIQSDTVPGRPDLLYILKHHLFSLRFRRLNLNANLND